MSLVRRTSGDLAALRRAGRVVAEMHESIRSAIRPGMTTASLDAIGREVLERRGARSNFLGYHGYPAVICASVNDVVIHGIPGPQVLEEGDLVSIDCGAIVDGWHGDAAFTVGGGLRVARRRSACSTRRGRPSTPGSRPCNPTAGSPTSVPRCRRSWRAPACRSCATTAATASAGPCTSGPTSRTTARPGRGPRLVPGVVLAVEPMVTAGGPEVEVLDDGWSVVSADGSLSAHVEHTIAITDDGPEILTRL